MSFSLLESYKLSDWSQIIHNTMFKQVYNGLQEDLLYAAILAVHKVYDITHSS